MAGFLSKLFGKKDSGRAAEPDRPLSGHADIVSDDDKAATRQRMEDEMDAQRQRRVDAAAPPAE